MDKKSVEEAGTGRGGKNLLTACGKSFLFWEDLRAMFEHLETEESKAAFFNALFIEIFDAAGVKNPVEGAERVAFEIARDVIREREEMEPRERRNLRSVVFFAEFRAMFARLQTVEEKMAFVRAVLNYSFEGVEPQLNGAAARTFEAARVLMDAEKERRERIREARRAAGRKGAEARGRAAEEKTVEAVEGAAGAVEPAKI